MKHKCWTIPRIHSREKCSPGISSLIGGFKSSASPFSPIFFFLIFSFSMVTSAATASSSATRVPGSLFTDASRQAVRARRSLDSTKAINWLYNDWAPPLPPTDDWAFHLNMHVIHKSTMTYTRPTRETKNSPKHFTNLSMLFVCGNT